MSSQFSRYQIFVHLKNFAVEVSASDKGDLRESDILLLMKKAMGANYDRQTSSY